MSEWAFYLSRAVRFVDKMAETKLGFEGLIETTEQETTGYTVNFSSTERESPEAAGAGAQEEITLIDTVDSSRAHLSPDEKVSHSNPKIAMQFYARSLHVCHCCTDGWSS